MPLASKRRAGRPKATLSCLNVQPSDMQAEGIVDFCLVSDDEVEVLEKSKPKKRGRKPKNIEPELESEPEQRRSKRFCK